MGFRETFREEGVEVAEDSIQIVAAVFLSAIIANNMPPDPGPVYIGGLTLATIILVFLMLIFARHLLERSDS